MRTDARRVLLWLEVIGFEGVKFGEALDTQSAEPDRQELIATFRAALKVHDRRLALELLERYSIDVNYCDLEGTSLLMAAAYRGYADVCLLLMERGADPTYGHQLAVRTPEGPTEIEWHSVWNRALMSRDKRTIELVETAIVRLQWSDQRAAMAAEGGRSNPWGAVHLVDSAARLGMLSTLWDMIDHKVPIDVDDANGFPPLTSAGSAGKMAACLLLVMHGADPLSLIQCGDAVSRDWLTALDVVGRRLFPGVVGSWTEAAISTEADLEARRRGDKLASDSEDIAKVFAPHLRPSYQSHIVECASRGDCPLSGGQWSALWRLPWDIVSSDGR